MSDPLKPITVKMFFPADMDVGQDRARWYIEGALRGWWQGFATENDPIRKMRNATVVFPASPPPPADPVKTDVERLVGETFQERVQPWMMACFGAEIASDRLERNDRFIEEALELTQASGYTAERAHQLVDYVFGRPDGEINQEVGGVMVTLAAHCLAHGVDMHVAAETELARVWTKVDQIREKQKSKPKGSALPIPTAPVVGDTKAVTVHAIGCDYCKGMGPELGSSGFICDRCETDWSADPPTAPEMIAYRPATNPDGEGEGA